MLNENNNNSNHNTKKNKKNKRRKKTKANRERERENEMRNGKLNVRDISNGNDNICKKRVHWVADLERTQTNGNEYDDDNNHKIEKSGKRKMKSIYLLDEHSQHIIESRM